MNEAKSEMSSIKKHIIDDDMVLTNDDLNALKEADRDFDAGKTKRL